MPDHRNRKRRGLDGNDQYRVMADVALPPWGADAALSIVGRAHPRVEGREKVTGRARYVGDLLLPRQLSARVLRSPHPHASIRRIDTSRAEALRGVHAVLSAANTLEIPWYEDSLLFDRTVRFAGDEVAAVAAETEELAEDALRLIAVEYEPLPFVSDLAAVLRSDVPRLRPSGNIAGQRTDGRGDIAAGFREADVIVEGAYTTQAALHNCLEPHGCTAWWEGDQLTLWTSTQSVFRVRSLTAQKLALPENRVRVVAQHVGGAFGSKQGAWKLDVIAALLSQRTGRPVQLLLDREAENLAAGNRNATRQRVRLGARRDGALTAIEADLALETGAYQVGGEASDIAGIYQSLYRCPNVSTTQTAWYTNTGPACAFRAPGYVEGAFALEQAMDELASRLGLDPLELRLRNYADDDQQRGRPYSRPESLRSCYEQATAAFGWRERQRPAASGSKRRGSGIAAHNWVAGAGSPPAYAWVKLNGDGSADVITGTQDIGTGTRTGLAQVAAEELGLPMGRVTLRLGDTAAGPYAPPSWGSATQASVSPAVRAAAAEAKQQLLEVAARLLEQPAGRLSVRDGQIWVAGQDRAASTVEAIMREIAPHMILGQGARGPNPADRSVRTFGVQCVEVEVDAETGEVTVLRVVSSNDCGRIINPTMVDSQVIGGVMQGLGFALTEERVVDTRTGIVLNPNLEEYKLPTAADLPAIQHVPADLPDPTANPTGAKGIGEPPLVPTAPAIANAIFDAVGVRLYEAPFTRDRVLTALAEQRKRRGAGGTRS